MIGILLGLIIITYIINRWALFYGLIDLHYKMEIDKDKAEIGEEIKITSIVENRKYLTVPFLNIKETFPKGFNIPQYKYSLFILPFQRVKRSYNMKGEKRGLYSISEAELELGDFFGFRSESQKVKINKEIIIYPEKLDFKEALVPIGSPYGDISVQRWIIDDPLMTIGIREYTGNEPERFIHWPSSLRYGELMVKNFDFTTDNSVMVLLNIETMKPSWRPIEGHLIEKAISLTRTVIEEFEEAKIPYGLATNAKNKNSLHERGYLIHQGLGQNHLYSILDILGSIDYKVDTFFENTIKNTMRKQVNFSTAVIITPRILETYIEPINNLKKAVDRLVVISVEDNLLEDLDNNIIKYRSR
ncbi:MAG: DUF58 domain-containing protein [Tissierellia bacterium]|nr:DUF58 domain-containing protein [Tissierellia bacterium]